MKGYQALAETIFVDVFGTEIVLHDEVRLNILRKHPETSFIIDGLAGALEEPDEIRRSVRDERVVLYTN